MEFLGQCVSVFHKGGPVMYVLLACSLLVVTIAVERFLYYRSTARGVKEFMKKLEFLLAGQRITEARQVSEQAGTIFGEIAAKGLRSYQEGGNVGKVLEGASMLAAAQLREYLNYLSAIVTLSPLLGLLGTVIGMIQSFSVLNVKSGQPMAITGGVGEALVATATGLVVATIALIAHTYFSHKIDKLVIVMEQEYLIIESLVPKKVKRSEVHEIA